MTFSNRSRLLTTAALLAAISSPAMHALAQDPSAQPAKPTTQPTSTDPQPAPAPPAAEPSAPSMATEPATAPAAETATEPASQPAEQPASQPAEQPASQPASLPAAPAPMYPPEPELSADERSARETFADKISQIAKVGLSNRTIGPVALRENAVLLGAAARANPNDARILRLLVEARLATNDLPGMEWALKQYVDVLNAKSQVDNVAMTELIDLYARRRESADEKLKYLQTIAGAESLSAEVRSHAAMRLAQTYFDRAQDTDADVAIDNAIKLNPVNPLAQRMRFEHRGAQASPADRVMMLTGILRASPLQPDVMALLAHELADAGLADASLTWYGQSFALSGRLGRGLNMPDFIDYACMLLVGGQPRDAIDAANKILSSDPGNADAAFIKLLAQKRMGGEQEIGAAEAQASDAALRRMQDLHAGLTNTESAPATQPADAVGEQVLGDVQRLKDPNAPVNPEIYGAYVSGLARLAWYEIYFNENPAAATKFIDALRGLLPEGDLNVVRLEGWSFLAQGKNDEARVKLSAVADRDPISKFGMIRMAAKEAGATGGSAGTTELTKLIGENSSGVTGAILVEALRDHGVRMVPPGPHAVAVRKELDAFPAGFLAFFNSPQTFYKVNAEPLKVKHAFGEALLAKITINNISEYDLSIGPDGAIRPDLWFDVQIQGLGAKLVGGVAYERMGQRLVLPAKGGSCSQIVRLDDGRVGEMIAGNPVMSIPLMFSVFTNPVTSQAGVVPGPGGYRTQFTRVMERGAAPIAQPQLQQALVAPLFSGTASERMRTAQVLSTYVATLRATPDLPPEMKQLADGFHDQLERAANIGSSGAGGGQEQMSPTAHAWVQYELAQIAVPARRERITEELLRNDVWTVRLLGVGLLQSLPPEQQKERARKLIETDSDPTIRAFASSILDTADIPLPSTQPAAPPPADGAIEANPFPAAAPESAPGMAPPGGTSPAPAPRDPFDLNPTPAPAPSNPPR